MRGKTVAIILATILTVPAAALAERPQVERDYISTYAEVAKAGAGPYDGRAGRHLTRDGVKTKNGSREAKPSELRDSIATMRGMLAPPAPAPVAAPAPTPAPAPVSAPAPAPAPSGGCPSYMAGEASSPGAVNPSSGAAGCFQVIPSTAAAHGCAPQAGASMSAQYECAARICATQGDSAWVAANPCGQVGRR